MRFKNNNNNEDRYGSPGLSCVDPSKVVKGKTNLLMPRIRDQQSFEKYVDGNVSMLEYTSGKKNNDSILTEEQYQLKSVTSMRVYKDIKRSKK